MNTYGTIISLKQCKQNFLRSEETKTWPMQGIVILSESFPGSWVLMVRLLSPFSGLGVWFSSGFIELTNTNFKYTGANQEKVSFAVAWDTFWLGDRQPRQVYLDMCHMKTICLLFGCLFFFFFLILLNKLPNLGPLEIVDESKNFFQCSLIASSWHVWLLIPIPDTSFLRNCLGDGVSDCWQTFLWWPSK